MTRPTHGDTLFKKSGRIPTTLYPVRVVTGLACDPAGRILMGKRSAQGLRPGLWELPGGKVERGESAEEALCREWKEELDIELHYPVDVGALLDVAIVPADLTFVVELYPVQIPQYQTAHARAHDELRWVDPTEAVRNLPCSPAFYLQYRAVLAWSRA